MTTPSVGSYIRRGLVAGMIAGIAMAVVLLGLGERSITDAIALEETLARQDSAPGTGVDADPSPFTRPQQLIGGVMGVLIYGAAMGSIFGVVFAAVRHRLAGPEDWRRSLRLGAVAFVVVFLVPWLKYPANPPAVGDPATIGRRSALYVIMLAWSLVAAWGTWRLRQWLATRTEATAQASVTSTEPAQLTLAMLAWAALVVAGFILLPGSLPDPLSPPATLIWRFRIATAAGAAVFWAVLATAFGWLGYRLVAPQRP